MSKDISSYKPVRFQSNVPCGVIIVGEHHGHSDATQLSLALIKHFQERGVDIAFGYELPATISRENCAECYIENAQKSIDEITVLKEMISRIEEFSQKEGGLPPSLTEKLNELHVEKKLEERSANYAVSHAKVLQMPGISYIAMDHDIVHTMPSEGEERAQANRQREQHMCDMLVTHLNQEVKPTLLIAHTGIMHMAPLYDGLVERGMDREKLQGFEISSISSIAIRLEYFSSRLSELSTSLVNGDKQGQPRHIKSFLSEIEGLDSTKQKCISMTEEMLASNGVLGKQEAKKEVEKQEARKEIARQEIPSYLQSLFDKDKNVKSKQGHVEALRNSSNGEREL